MPDHASDRLEELFGRFCNDGDAEAAAADVRAAEQLLDLYPAPEPAPETLAEIRRRMMLTLRLRRRRRRAVFRGLTAAAALLAIAVIARFTGGPAGPVAVNQAGILPVAIWESDNVAADDLEIAYFDAEIRQIETQLRRLEGGDRDGDSDRLERIEMELMQIDTVFWKE